MIAVTSWFSKLDFRRRQLGMSKAALATRANVSRPTVDRILSEREESPRISNVTAIAAALGVEVRLVDNVITVVDQKSAQEFRRQQALNKAKRIVKMVQGNMALEAQAVGTDTVDEMVDQTVCELLAGSPRKLWE
jgi:transcriptional regulator with XRE-family HTH domain